MNGIHGVKGVAGGSDHLQFNAGAAAKSAEPDEMYEYSQALIVEAIISKFKWGDGEIREKFGMSREQLREKIDAFGFVPPSIKPQLLKNIPNSPFKDDIIVMLSRNKTITMKESRWRKLFPDYEVMFDVESHEELNNGGDEAKEQPANHVPETVAATTEDQAGQVSGGKDVESAPIQTEPAPTPADTKELGKKHRGRKEVAEIPEEVLEQIFKKDLPSDKLTGELRLAKGISFATLAKRVSAKVGEIGPTYFSKFVNLGHFKPTKERMEAAAEVFGLKGLWKDLFLDSWQNFGPHKKESSARSGGTGGTKKGSYKYVELPEIPTEALAEIFSDQDLSFNDLMGRLAREKQATQRQLAKAANMNDAYLSTLLNKPGYIFARDKVIAFADRLGLKGEDRDRFIERSGCGIEAAAASPAVRSGKRGPHKLVELQEITEEELKEIYNDTSLEFMHFLGKLYAAKRVRAKALAVEFGLNIAYFSTAKNTANYRPYKELAEKLAVRLGIKDDEENKWLTLYRQRWENPKPPSKWQSSRESVVEANLRPAEKPEEQNIGNGSLLHQAFECLCKKYGVEMEPLIGKFRHGDREWALNASVKLARELKISDVEANFLGTSFGFSFSDKLTVAISGPGSAICNLLVIALKGEKDIKIVTTI